MIVGRGHGPVGAWWFESADEAEPSGGRALQELLRRIELVAQILESAELLFPRRMRFSGWLAGSVDGGSLHRVEGDDVIVDLSGSADGLAERGFAALRRQIEEGRYPVEVEVTGTGIVLDADGGRHEHEGVAWLTARTLDHHSVTIGVQSDAFLQWSVNGNEHEALWRRNEPRLTGALATVRTMLGEEPWSESTPHAHIDGLRLVNRRDVEGDIVPTLDA